MSAPTRQMPRKNLGEVLLVVMSVLIAAIFLNLSSRSEEAITPNDKFFKVSLGSSPVIDVEQWTLLIDGAGDHPMNITYSDLAPFQT